MKFVDVIDIYKFVQVFGNQTWVIDHLVRIRLWRPQYSRSHPDGILMGQFWQVK